MWTASWSSVKAKRTTPPCCTTVKRSAQLDVAVDPVEGTSLLAYGRPNAISTVAVAPRGSMFNPGPS